MRGALLTIFAAALAWCGDTIVLDRRGAQGPVTFDHRAHLKAAPDPNSPHKAEPAAPCAGCHHTRDKAEIIQLAQCAACHRAEGDPDNPKNRDSDELHRKRAFHDKCIGCHLSFAGKPDLKPPADCADCHKTAGA